MLLLAVLFTDNEQAVQSKFSGLDLAALGVSFGDGSSALSANGTLVYRGAAFEYSMTDVGGIDAKYHIFCDKGMEARALLGLGLGGAIASGGHVSAIIKGLLSLGEVLGSALDATAIYWQPASVISAFSYYAEAVSQYDLGGAFPSLVTIGFDTSTHDSVQTLGLAYLCGQELLFERGGLPLNEAMRYVVRLVHDMATNGAIKHQIDVPGLDDAERLLLSPSDERNLVVVHRIDGQNGFNRAG